MSEPVRLYDENGVEVSNPDEALVGYKRVRNPDGTITSVRGFNPEALIAQRAKYENMPPSGQVVYGGPSVAEEDSDE